MGDETNTSWWRGAWSSIAFSVQAVVAAAVGVRKAIFPPPECKADRVIRWLLLLDLTFLLLLTRWAYDPPVMFAAIIAANAVGAIFGLLFAVPRRDKDAKRSPISGNTSLDDVSDWLTKTIIGAGLVSWSSILARLDQSGAYVGVAMASYEQESIVAGGVAVLLASFGLGAIIGYLWVGFDENRVARLTVSAWGAFTVGVLMDDGSTELELDLSQVPSAPALFRSR